MTISRASWKARKPDAITRISERERRYFVVHHTAGPLTQTVREIQNFHMDTRGWADIGYNFLVHPRTGDVYEGRGWGVVGAHAEGHNREALGVCVIGNNPELSAAARNALSQLYTDACRRADRTLLLRGHRQMSGAATACPGERLLKIIKAGLMPPAPEVTDMDVAQLLDATENGKPLRERLEAIAVSYAGAPLPPGRSLAHVIADVHTAVQGIERRLAAIEAKLAPPS